MSRKSDLENRIDVKKRLLAKHERLSKTRSSAPARARLLRQATAYRNQIRILENELSQVK